MSEHTDKTTQEPPEWRDWCTAVMRRNDSKPFYPGDVTSRVVPVPPGDDGQLFPRTGSKEVAEVESSVITPVIVTLAVIFVMVVSALVWFLRKKHMQSHMSVEMAARSVERADADAPSSPKAEELETASTFAIEELGEADGGMRNMNISSSSPT